MIKERVLVEAGAEERAQKVIVAQKQRFRYHELRTLAEAFGIKGRKLAPDETDWPTLFRAICDEIHISIIQASRAGVMWSFDKRGAT
eukprot:2929669-Prymnesium_polylepis.1